MPCSKCGRTAKREWLLFRFDREKKELFCPFCRPFSIDKQGQGGSTLLIFCYLALLMGLFAQTSTFLEDYNSIDQDIEKARELMEMDPGNVTEISHGQEVKLVGLINSSLEAPIKEEQRDDGRWYWNKNNFTLVQPGGDIPVQVSWKTKVYVFNASWHSPREFRTGEEIRVLGTVGNQNGTLVLEAGYLLHRDPDVDEMMAVHWLNILIICCLTLIFSPFLLNTIFPLRQAKSISPKSLEPNWVTGVRQGVDEQTEERLLQGARVIKGKGASLGSLQVALFFSVPFVVLALTLSIFESSFYFIVVPLMVGMSLIFVFIPLPNLLDQYRTTARKVVISEEGILIYGTPREPLLLTIPELGVSSWYEDLKLNSEMSAALGGLEQEYKKAKMEEEKEGYYQHLKEESQNIGPKKENPPPGET